MPLPVIAIVGRPNVGKSTLFNRLVGRRRALVMDTPGVTRDRLHGICRFGAWETEVVDTGGLDPTAREDLTVGVRRQVLEAIGKADLLLFIVDAREGATPLDQEVGRLLRRTRKPVIVVANKVDTARQLSALGEVYELGISPVVPVSAEHGRGVADLLEIAAGLLPAGGVAPAEEVPVARLAFIGRPNVGKSSLVNAILGEERVVVHPDPGTTRDAVDTPVRIQGRPFLLIDTAGLRRKGRLAQPLERLAAIMARKSLDRCDLALVVLDASEEITAQDARIAGYAEAAGRGVVLVLNKWDLVRAPDRAPALTRALRERLPFLPHAPVVFTSAKTGEGIPKLFEAVERVAAEFTKEVPTPDLNRVLGKATAKHPPAAVRGRTFKVYYATQIGVRPPTFLLFVNDPRALHVSYERFLIGALREAFGFAGSPLRLRLRRRRAGAVGAGASRGA